MRSRKTAVQLAAPGPGVDGRSVFALARDPELTDFRFGDFAINTVSKHIFGPKSAAGWPDIGMIKGDSGWAPVVSIVTDSARRVIKIVDWVGGQGTKPAVNVFVGPIGTVATAAEAVDIRGPQGPAMLVTGLTAGSGAMDYTHQVAAGAAPSGDNAKWSIMQLFEPGGSMAAVSTLAASGLSVPAGVTRMRVGANWWKRAAAAPLHSVTYRTTDRFTASGTTDSLNGGYWVPEANLTDIALAGGVPGNDNSAALTAARAAAPDGPVVAWGPGYNIGTQFPYWQGTIKPRDSRGVMFLDGTQDSPRTGPKSPHIWSEYYDACDDDTYRVPGNIFIHASKIGGQKPVEGLTVIFDNRFDGVTAGKDHQGLYGIGAHLRARGHANNVRMAALWGITQIMPGITPLYSHVVELNFANYGADFGYPGANTNGKAAMLNLSLTDAGQFPISDFIVMQAPAGGGAYRGLFVRRNAIAGGSSSLLGDGEIASWEGGSNGGNRYGGIRYRNYLRYGMKTLEADVLPVLWMKPSANQGLYWANDPGDETERSFLRQESDSTLVMRSRLGRLALQVKGTTTQAVLDADGSGKALFGIGIGLATPTATLDINGQTLRLRTAKTPAAANDTGVAGTICRDANYIYVCTATDTWKRAALTTW